MHSEQKPNDPIEISGAGPAGLAAAITIAKAGGRAIVHEHNADVGQRFHGDFQGIENWTTKGDVLEELRGIGIEADFDQTPYREMLIYDPAGGEHRFRSPEPFFYLVRRGSQPGMLDASLKEQALALGVEIRFGDPCHHLPRGGIAAQGPRGADAIAIGYVFETDMADGAFGAVSDRLAPKGYSYLLIHNGRGTLAAAIFEDYHQEKVYLQRTLDFFSEKVGVRMKNEHRFGGTGNFLAPRSARHGKVLLAGEAAGFQDALWGFGMRYAMLSGHLAAKAILDRVPGEYDSLWQSRFGGQLRASIVNRYLYEKLGDTGYSALLREVREHGDTRGWLRAHYAETWWKPAMFLIAKRAVRTSRKEAVCVMEGCDCTWCRCHHDLHKEVQQKEAM